MNKALPVKREPGVVEAEAEEGQQEVQLLVDLWLRVSDVRLKIRFIYASVLSAFLQSERLEIQQTLV